MKIAVIGSGISGLTAAYVLQREHDVTLLEAGEHIGGHSLTVDAEQDGVRYAVDTGFVVYNETTYPNFVRLLQQLGVGSQATRMSFSVACEASGIEYCGTSLNTLFAQRRNLVNLAFVRMLWDIARFNRTARRAVARGKAAGTLGSFLDRAAPSPRLREDYLIPLVSAVWSLDPNRVDDFPAEFFLRFSERHRLLQLRDQLQWRVIRGGSREYVRALVARLRNDVRIGTPVRGVRRERDGVELTLSGGIRQRFDHVVISAHSDQALRMLEDPTDDEREVLGAIEYQDNEAVLHTDTALLPRSRRAWANWNYRVPAARGDRPVTTYDMSGLQGLATREPFCVTLNRTDAVDPDRVVRRLSFAHPVYNTKAVEAQGRKSRISGRNRTHYCGAYWGFGFHEDGVSSALDACAGFGLRL